MIIKDVRDIITVNNFDNIMRTKKSFSFYQNIEYIQNNSDGSVIYINNTKYISKNRTKYNVEFILKLHFSSISSYYKGIQFYLNYQYNIPIYINNNLILIQSGAMKNYETFWVNFKQIKLIKDNTIYFNSGNKIKFSNNDSYWIKQFVKVNEISVLFNHLNK